MTRNRQRICDAPAIRVPARLVSPDGNFLLELQNADAPGFVLYDMRRPEGQRAIWSAKL